MNDIVIEGLSTVISLAVGGLVGYVVAIRYRAESSQKGDAADSAGFPQRYVCAVPTDAADS